MAAAAGVGGDGDLSISVKINSILEATDPGIWYQLCLPGLDKIKPRVGHSLLPGSQNGKLILLGGGQHEGALAEMWTIDLMAKKGEEGDGETSAVQMSPTIEGHKARYEFLCAKQRIENDQDRIWIFGGADSQLTFNDVGYLENGCWIESVSGGEIPSSRTQGGNSTLLEFNGKSYLIVFGGGQAGVESVQDGNLHLYDIEKQNWIIVSVKSDIPPVTQGHVITSFDSKIFLHGGLNNSSLHENIYMIDVGPFLDSNQAVGWIQLEQTGKKPPGRAAHGIVKSPSSKSFFIFGGLGEYGCHNDLWEFSTESRCWTQIGGGNKGTDFGEASGPCARLGLSLTSLCVNQTTYLIIHGGINSEGTMFNDLWVKKM